MPRSARLILEAGAVLLVGCLVALLANQLSPKGLSLSRDYFPGASRPPTPLPLASVPAPQANGQTNPPPAPTNTTIARLQAHGIQVADSNLVIQSFHDPLHAQELIIFVDARDDRHYQEGHVPGAFLFDHYRPAEYLPAVLPACLTAEKVILYCNGGNCEDSEFAAVTLKDAGVPAARLWVYPGGFSEWLTNGLPVETGPRKSGVFKEARP